MHLAQRAYALLVLTAVLAIAGIWSGEPALGGLWRLPCMLLLLGLAIESAVLRRASIRAELETAPRAFLGREQAAAFTFRNDSSRAVALEYAPALPDGFEPLLEVRKVVAPARGVARDPFMLFPVGLGAQAPLALPARLLGSWGLAWWSRVLRPTGTVSVAPEAWHANVGRPRGDPRGDRSRKAIGAGAELHQLRPYRPGDPPARVDWKATARTRRLVTREFSEDQHLDILLAIDAGRSSRVRARRLDRFGLYANVAARLAQIATPNDDRVGLLVFSDRILAACMPARGLAAVTRIRGALEGVRVESTEADPTAAAVRIRGMLRHRGLVVLLTDLDDVNMAEPLARAVQLLSPPHFVVVGGVRSAEIAALSVKSDPWVALAAQEHEARVSLQRLQLRRLGVPVVVTAPELLEKSLFATYEALRRSRRL